MARLLKPKPPLVVEQVIGRHVIGDVEIDLVVVVQVGGDDAQPAPVRIDEARLGGHVDKPRAVVAKDVIGERRIITRHTDVMPGRVGLLAALGVAWDHRRGSGRRRDRDRRRRRGRRTPPRSASRDRRRARPGP